MKNLLLVSAVVLLLVSCTDGIYVSGTRYYDSYYWRYPYYGYYYYGHPYYRTPYYYTPKHYYRLPVIHREAPRSPSKQEYTPPRYRPGLAQPPYNRNGRR